MPGGSRMYGSDDYMFLFGKKNAQEDAAKQDALQVKNAVLSNKGEAGKGKVKGEAEAEAEGDKKIAGKDSEKSAGKKPEDGSPRNAAKNASKKNSAGKAYDAAHAEKNEGKAEPPQAPQEKTVGDILKEEGVIREETKSSKMKVEQEVDLNQMLMNIEKLGVEVGALRDVKFNADERIKELSESIGEMRSIIFQRDGAVKDAQMEIEKLNDAVAGIKPEKIAAEMKKREQEFLEAGAKVEKLERMGADFARQISGMQKILDNVKSMENLVSVSREIEDKLSRMEELKNAAERDAEKSEKMYLEMERRMRDLTQMKESVRKLDELTRELVKSMDEEKIKSSGFVNKEDVQKALEDALKLPGGGKTQEDLARERAEAESLLKNLEMQYKKGMISRESFEEVRDKNRALIQMLDGEIKNFDATKNPRTLFEWVENVQNELKELQIKLSFYSRKNPNAPAQIQPGQGQYYENALPEPAPDMSRRIIRLDSPVAGFARHGETGAMRENPPVAENNEAEGIMYLISEVEDQYRKGMISETTYNEMIMKNRKRLAEMRRERQQPPEAMDAGDSMAKRLDGLHRDIELLRSGVRSR